MQELEVYSMMGTEGFTRLVAFYRQVPQDDVLGLMYSADGSSRCRTAPPRFRRPGAAYCRRSCLGYVLNHHSATLKPFHVRQT